ncbi:MAG TPA: dihydrofolate reductase family protein [Flavilitoribacter sp.]|nr:dihydrofolate reductase family protein [Flavilitoribacter sp.]HMQ90806.1 dihydrofolate reductase family protein [Flavilitoribacter sp.]
MRKLKLQMQVSVDGFVAGPNGEMDWMQWNWDDGLKAFVNALTEPVDTILLGRKLAEGFIPAWKSRIGDPAAEEELAFAHKMIDTPKIVFTKTLDSSEWENTELEKGDFVSQITGLKQQPGSDIIVYGGATFVASLIEKGLIDDLYLFVNPAATGGGLRIFGGRTNLALAASRAFDCGIVLLHYKPA